MSCRVFDRFSALWLAGLGPPGNDGASWAGDATVLFNEAARRLETRDFGAIFSKFFGFTEAKQCQEAQEDFLQTITEWKPRSLEVLTYKTFPKPVQFHCINGLPDI